MKKKKKKNMLIIRNRRLRRCKDIIIKNTNEIEKNRKEIRFTDNNNNNKNIEIEEEEKTIYI